MTVNITAGNVPKCAFPRNLAVFGPGTLALWLFFGTKMHSPKKLRHRVVWGVHVRPRFVRSTYCSFLHPAVTSSCSDSPLCTSITPSLFTLGLKPTSFTSEILPPRPPPPVVSLIPPGLPSRSRTFSRNVSSELLGF